VQRRLAESISFPGDLLFLSGRRGIGNSISRRVLLSAYGPLVFRRVASALSELAAGLRGSSLLERDDFPDGRLRRFRPSHCDWAMRSVGPGAPGNHAHRDCHRRSSQGAGGPISREVRGGAREMITAGSRFGRDF
jgi:hypothetical protein